MLNPTPEEKMSKLLKLIGNAATCGNENRPGCGAQIIWVSTRYKKAMPLNPDGTPHWASCPNVRQFRKEKAEAKHG